MSGSRGSARAAPDPFPPGFLFGFSTAGYEVEGGFNGLGGLGNNWVSWEQSRRAERSGIGCDFWEHPSELLERAASLGSNAFGLSIEWARVEPEEGVIDKAAIDHYAAILDECSERGMEAVVSLHHFSHPWWLGEEFWLTPGSPDRFAAHVARLVPHLAPHCNRWVTMHQPAALAMRGWVTGTHPPGRRLGVSDAFSVLDNLLTAHVLSYNAIHEIQPESTVTLVSGASPVYEQSRLPIDLLCARSQGVPRAEVDDWIEERRSLHDVSIPPEHWGDLARRRAVATLSPFGSSSRSYSGGGVLAVSLERLRSRLSRQCPRRVLDVIYESVAARPLDVAAYELDQSPGLSLASWCRSQRGLIPDMPVWVAEAGRLSPERLRVLLGVVSSGVILDCYLNRSLVPGYQWGSFHSGSGLYEVERSPDCSKVRWPDADVGGRDPAAETKRVLLGSGPGGRSA